MITVLTVNYYSAADLAMLVRSLAAQDCGQPIELIVTNNSIEETITCEADSRLSIQIINSANVGFAAGINRAYRASQGETIMIANPDVQLLPGTLAGALASLNIHSEAGVILPLLRYPEGSVQPSIRMFYSWPVVLYARTIIRGLGYRPRFFRHYLCEHVRQDKATEVDWGLGAAMFLRRSDLSRESIFDERFFLYFEDVDLCFRTWQSGRKVMFCPQIECIHAHRRESKNPFSRAGIKHFKSLLQFAWKYGGLPRRPAPRPHSPLHA